MTKISGLKVLITGGSSGIGKAVIVDASNKYEYLLNIECNHAITYIKDDYFGIQKCKI